MTTNTSEIAVPENVPSVLNDGMLAEISGFAAALAKLDELGVGYESMSDYGTGFTVIDKAKLIGVPFIVLEWRFNGSDVSDNGFVSVALVTKDERKLIINDGGTGINQQLRDVTAARKAKQHTAPQNGLFVPGGLTASNYTYTDDKGKQKAATTYYLSEATQPETA